MPNGVLLLDKPKGLTSHDVVARVRRALGTKKVGHAGTLDPMATGLLIVGVGPSTRLLTHLVGLDKTYLATVRLGESTTTEDAEGETTAVADPAALVGVDDRAIAAAAAGLTGAIMQRPSSVSAIKVDGVRSYARVRSGEDVELAARPIVVHAFEVLEVRPGGGRVDVDVRVSCSSGTYVRALARDLGDALGVGGHLTALRRTRVGPFRVDDAQPVPPWPTAGEAPPVLSPLAPAEVAGAILPVVRLDARQAADLANGKRLRVEHPDAPLVAAVAPDGTLVGLVAVTGGATRVVTNFPVAPGDDAGTSGERR